MTLPEGVKDLTYAFNSCFSLKYIEIPDSDAEKVVTVGDVVDNIKENVKKNTMFDYMLNFFKFYPNQLEKSVF